MKSFVSTLCVVFALGVGCSDLEEVADVGLDIGIGGTPDVIPPPVPGPRVYDGPCTVIDDLVIRSDVGGFVHLRNTTQPVVNYVLLIDDIDGATAAVDVYVASPNLAALEGQVVDLSQSPNNNTGTCNLCMLVNLNCDQDALNCMGPLLFPRSGRAVAQRLTTGAVGDVIVEMRDVELEPIAIIDGDFNSQSAAQSPSDCFYIEQFLAGAPPSVASDCNFGFQCQFEDTIGNRGGGGS